MDKMIQWIDGFLFYAKDKYELLQNIEKFFSVCNENSFFIHPNKTALFKKEVKFGGRLSLKTEFSLTQGILKLSET